MKNKVILITGASSGIGAALAIAYAQPNTHLLLTGRNAQRLQHITEQCHALGATVCTTCIDIRAKTEFTAWILSQDLATPIDLIIANAGCSTTQLKTANTPDELIAANMIDIHLHGTLNTIDPILRRMLTRGHGQIALMSSLNALVPLGRSRIYGALKAAILHYGLAARAYYQSKNIQFNIICPGWVQSALTDLNDYTMPFMLTPQDAAKRIIKGLNKNKAVIAFPWPLRCLIYCYRILPLSLQQLIARKS